MMLSVAYAGYLFFSALIFTRAEVSLHRTEVWHQDACRPADGLGICEYRDVPGIGTRIWKDWDLLNYQLGLATVSCRHGIETCYQPHNELASHGRLLEIIGLHPHRRSMVLPVNSQVELGFQRLLQVVRIVLGASCACLIVEDLPYFNISFVGHTMASVLPQSVGPHVGFFMEELFSQEVISRHAIDVLSVNLLDFIGFLQQNEPGYAESFFGMISIMADQRQWFLKQTLDRFSQHEVPSAFEIANNESIVYVKKAVNFLAEASAHCMFLDDGVKYGFNVLKYLARQSLARLAVIGQPLFDPIIKISTKLQSLRNGGTCDGGSFTYRQQACIDRCFTSPSFHKDSAFLASAEQKDGVLVHIVSAALDHSNKNEEIMIELAVFTERPESRWLPMAGGADLDQITCLPETDMRDWKLSCHSNGYKVTSQCSAIMYHRSIVTLRCPFLNNGNITNCNAIADFPEVNTTSRWDIPFSFPSEYLDGSNDHIEIAMCVQPVWGYEDLPGKARLDDWFRYHLEIGFDEISVYDIDGSFSEFLLPWIESGRVRYIPNFSASFSRELYEWMHPNGNHRGEMMILDDIYIDIRKPHTGNFMEPTFAHCIMHYRRQQTKWVLLTAFDQFLSFHPKYIVTGKKPLNQWLATYDQTHHRISHISVYTCEVYEPYSNRSNFFQNEIWRTTECIMPNSLVNPENVFTSILEWTRGRPRTHWAHEQPELVRSLHFVNWGRAPGEERCSPDMNHYHTRAAPCNTPDSSLAWFANVTI